MMDSKLLVHGLGSALSKKWPNLYAGPYSRSSKETFVWVPKDGKYLMPIMYSVPWDPKRMGQQPRQ